MAQTFKYSGVIYDSPTASQVDFALTTSGGDNIPYLEGDHIHVYTADSGKTDWTEIKRGTASDEWDFKSDDPKVVRFVTAPGTGKDVRLLRITPYETKYTTFQEGSLLTSNQLNDGEEFSMFVDQEIFDETLKIREEGKPSGDLIDTADQKAQTTSWEDNDDKIATAGAIAFRHDNVVGDGSSYPGSGNKGQRGKLRIDNSSTPQKLFWWDESLSTPAWVEVETKGQKGDKGDAATIEVGTTTTLDAGKDATVSNSGTTSAAKFDFGIPKGPKGDPGTNGTDGTDGKVVEVQAGDGIAVDNTDDTKPKVSAKLNGSTLTNGTDGLSVTTPYEEPTSDGSFVRKKAGSTFTWEAESTGGTSLWTRSSSQLSPATNGDGVLVKNGSGDTKITLSSDGNLSGQQFISGSNPNGGTNAGTRLRPTGNLQITNDGGTAINIMNKGESAQKVEITSNGAATFAGTVQSGNNALNGNDSGVLLRGTTGMIHVTSTTGSSAIWHGFTKDNSSPTSTINANGSVSFAGSAHFNSSGGNNDFRVDGDNASNAFFVDASEDRVGFNTNTTANFNQFNQKARVNIFGDEGLGLTRGGSSVSSNTIFFKKTRGNAINDVTSVNSGDSLGKIQFVGTDGTNPIAAAQIEAFVDTAPGTNDMPGRLSFFTTANGASSMTERMRINNAGRMILMGTSPEGIQFGTTNSGGSITSQTLGDYEEGTWTPTVTGSNGAAFTVSSVNCQYVKVGSLVTLVADFLVQMTTAANVFAQIGGVPFTRRANTPFVAFPMANAGGTSWGRQNSEQCFLRANSSLASSNAGLQLSLAATEFWPDSTNVTVSFTMSYITSQ